MQQSAVSTGFEWLELHAAHGYLAYSCQSPLSNQRIDDYGGSFANRIRFTLETTRAMQELWPDDKQFSVRLSVSDWVEGGWTLEDSIELSRLLKDAGMDLIDCSSVYGTSGLKYPVAPGWQVPFAEAIRKEAGIATAAVGIINQAEQAGAIIREGKADTVLLASECYAICISRGTQPVRWGRMMHCTCRRLMIM